MGDMVAGTGRRVYAPKRQGWGRVRIGGEQLWVNIQRNWNL